ncbi:MAG: acetate/propionate family kinase [Rhodospirillales bacterium]
MRDAILVLNAGSSSIKFAGYVDGGAGEPTLLAKGQIEGIGTAPSFEARNEGGGVIGEHRWPEDAAVKHAECLQFLIEWIHRNATAVRLVAAGHRVVHGGVTFATATRIDDAVMDELETLVPLAPLHQPHNLAAIRALADLDPDLPQVACFDTAFHRTQPAVAQMFALPPAVTDGVVRRYGFHGLSYEYIARRLPEVAPRASRVVVAHLGSGASMCALSDGVSIESTMGFTAVDGLPMGTRTGALDPGVVLYLVQQRRYDGAAIERLLYKESGLLGVSGVSNDMRVLLASDDPRAAAAVELFVYHIAKHLGALAAALQGLDALVFTAGIGENAPAIRDRVCRRAAWLGIEIDDRANVRGGPRISAEASPVSVWVIPTDEERMIAIHTARVLHG